jgi:hypothetical protein
VFNALPQMPGITTDLWLVHCYLMYSFQHQTRWHYCLLLEALCEPSVIWPHIAALLQKVVALLQKLRQVAQLVMPLQARQKTVSALCSVDASTNASVVQGCKDGQHRVQVQGSGKKAGAPCVCKAQLSRPSDCC